MCRIPSSHRYQRFLQKPNRRQFFIYHATRKIYLNNSTTSYSPHTSAHFIHLPLIYVLTSSFKHLSRSLGAIRQSQRNNLIVSWEFDLCTAPIRCLFVCGWHTMLTFSKMTKGPLTPPMVLYRILGVTRYDDDSRGSPMIASLDGGDRVVGGCRTSALGSLSYCRAED